MSRSTVCALVALALSYSSVNAQIPGIPAVPGVPSAAAPATGAAPAAPPSNIWSMLCMTPAQKQACQQKLCSMQAVQFLGGALTPVSALSGGLLPSCCPGPNSANPADLLKPADSAEGAAARIKKNEADAKARRAACRYLATVDCKRYPEAEAALIHSLRADENECVRYEAAIGFATGCCCTKRVLEALVLTVSGKKTNDPAEASPRVRAAAAVALERCLRCYCEVDAQTPADKPLEKAKPAGKARLQPDPLVEEGRTVLAEYKKQRQPAPPAAKPVVAATTPEPPQVIPVAAPAPLPPSTTELTLTDVPAAEERPLPPTGQRDMWSVLRHTFRSR